MLREWEAIAQVTASVCRDLMMDLYCCCCCKCQRSCQGARGGSARNSGGGSGGGGGRAGRWSKEGREEMKTATSRGRSQRSAGHRSVGWAVQLNKCGIVCSAVLHSGHIGEGSLPILNR